MKTLEPLLVPLIIVTLAALVYVANTLHTQERDCRCQERYQCVMVPRVVPNPAGPKKSRDLREQRP